MASNTPTHDYTHLNGHRFHHLHWPGDDPPLVYLPGFIASAYGALNLARVAAPSRRVLALDLRGRGASDKPDSPYGVQTHLQDFAAWLDAHALNDFILTGHSFGAILAARYASEHPDQVRQMIWFDGGLPPSRNAYDLFVAYHSQLTYDYSSVEAYIDGYRNIPTMQPWTLEADALTRANVREQEDGRAQRVVPPYVVERELAALTYTELEALFPIYQKLHMPVLLIRAGMGSFGPDDQHITDERLAQLQAHMRDLTVYTMPQAGHTSVLTVPDTGRDAAIQHFLGIA